MNLKQLKYFLVVAEERQITSAAKKLFIAQPPLSYQLKQLEKELGELKTELFKLKFSLATNGLDNPMKIKEVKKDIAKINTVLTERKIAEAKA